MSKADLSSFRVGDHIRPLTFHVTRDVIDAFGDIANDHNPVHFDDEFARSRGFAGAIAHGSISASFLIDMLSGWLADWPLDRDSIDISFIAPVLVNDHVTARGTIVSIGSDEMQCDIWCENEAQKKVIAGTARISLARTSRS
jgi:acyl dehydratase